MPSSVKSSLSLFSIYPGTFSPDAYEVPALHRVIQAQSYTSSKSGKVTPAQFVCVPSIDITNDVIVFKPLFQSLIDSAQENMVKEFMKSGHVPANVDSLEVLRDWMQESSGLRLTKENIKTWYLAELRELVITMAKEVRLAKGLDEQTSRNQSLTVSANVLDWLQKLSAPSPDLSKEKALTLRDKYVSFAEESAMKSSLLRRLESVINPKEKFSVSSKDEIE
jgi:hypothetical protein